MFRVVEPSRKNWAECSEKIWGSRLARNRNGNQGFRLGARIQVPRSSAPVPFSSVQVANHVPRQNRGSSADVCMSFAGESGPELQFGKPRAIHKVKAMVVGPPVTLTSQLAGPQPYRELQIPLLYDHRYFFFSRQQKWSISR